MATFAVRRSRRARSHPGIAHDSVRRGPATRRRSRFTAAMPGVVAVAVLASGVLAAPVASRPVAANAAAATPPRPTALWEWGTEYFPGHEPRKLVTEYVTPPDPASGYAPGTYWAHVSTTGYQTLGIRTDGSLWGWGSNALGTAGVGSTLMTEPPTRLLPGTAKFSSVSTSDKTSAAIDSDGNLFMWGYNGYGALGDGSTTDRFVPVPAGAGRAWKQVATAGTHTVAIATDGSLWSWGRASFGKLGDGSTTDRSVPGRVGNATDWASVSISSDHALAVKADGTLWGWGENFMGGLGDGTSHERDTPIRVGIDSDWVSAMSSGYFSVGLKADGSRWGWGPNSNGQMGDGTAVTSLVPTRSDSGNDWKALSVGLQSVFGIKTDGSLWYWGFDLTGHLVGQGWVVTPTRIGSQTGWTEVSSGNSYAMAIGRPAGESSLGSVLGCGVTIGTGHSIESATIGGPALPTYDDPALTTVPGHLKALASGSGTGGGPSSFPPKPVPNGESIAIADDGGIYTWGANEHGQLLDGTTNPQIGIGGEDTTHSLSSVAAGGDNTAFIESDGTLWIAGSNAAGQLGTGEYNTIVIHTDAREVGTNTNWRTVALGTAHVSTFA